MAIRQSQPNRTRKSLIAMTMRVGSGSSAPRLANIAPKVGMTFHRMTATTRPAITMTAMGYTIADLTWPLSLTFFSMYVARRFRIVSRMPPASPAAIMLVNSGSNVLGCLRIASASVWPFSTSPRVWRIVAAKFASSSWLPRISRHCTSGRPASIMTENCRVKIARFLGETPLPSLPFFGLASAFAFTGVTLVTRTCSRRSIAVTASRVSATRSPAMFSPALVRPVKANVGMLVLWKPPLLYRRIAFPAAVGARGARPYPV